MGAWGLASNENDWTYDYLGTRIDARTVGVVLTDTGKRDIWNILVEERGVQEDDVPIGVIVFLVKVGALLPVVVIQGGLHALQTEIPGDFFPVDVERRCEIVKEEIKLLEKAIEQGGQLPAIGVKRIGLGAD
jgi:hypothetical protein